MEDGPLSKKPRTENSKSSAVFCPYLGTVNRPLLDFDFEKLCSVSLTRQNVYCCLVCGQYFHGRGPKTHLAKHALEQGHYMHLNLSDKKVCCLPENYEVQDASLNDVKFNLDPRYTEEDIARFDTQPQIGKALDGAEFTVGCMGLNDLKKTSYVNVIVQMLCTVTPLRNFLIRLDWSNKQKCDMVILTLGELIRKIFNFKNFKGIISPHEFTQAVSVASHKSFSIGKQSEPVHLLLWLIDRFRRKSGKKGKEIVEECFQGKIMVCRHKTDPNSIQWKEEDVTQSTREFYMITLETPVAPVFKDTINRNLIPQVPIFEILQTFDGQTTQEKDGVFKTQSFWEFPEFLLVHIKRFSTNAFFVEKNPTIVTFPVKNLELKDYLHPDSPYNKGTRYNLVANVCHVGTPQDGTYKVYVLYGPEKEWLETEDLRVTPAMPQQVAQSEAYLQLYRLAAEGEE